MPKKYSTDKERKDARLKSQRDYLSRNRDKSRQRCRAWQANNSEHRAAKDREKNRELRIFVLSHYSPPTPRCRCCGEAVYEFLHLHHKDGGGGKHREKVGRGANFYKWIIKNDFPLGYEVLCANCDEAEGHYGICPHRTLRTFAHANA
jgi:hypothetical protein